ncbi:unnamed protein product, partial [marine sediment metagenome]
MQIGQGIRIYPKGKVPKVVLTSTQKKILSVVKEKPDLTQREIATKTKLPKSTVGWNIIRLKRKRLMDLPEKMVPEPKESLTEEPEVAERKPEAEELEYSPLQSRLNSVRELSVEYNGLGNIPEEILTQQSLTLQSIG